MPRQEIVVLLGCHRSGSSLAASVLQALGLRLGGPLIGPKEDNLAGFFEHAAIVAETKLIEKQLNRFHASTTGTLPFPTGWLDRKDVRASAERLERILTAELSANEGYLWGFKDPRTVRLLPLWERIFEKLSLKAQYVISLREPASIIQSMIRRNDLAASEAELIWIRHMIALVRHAALRTGIYVRYEDWFDDGLAQVALLLRRTGLPEPPASKLQKTLTSLVEKRLDHSGSPASVCLSPFSQRLKELLDAAATGKDVSKRRSRILKDFDDFQALSSPWSAAAEGQEFLIDRLSFIGRHLGRAERALAERKKRFDSIEATLQSDRRESRAALRIREDEVAATRKELTEREHELQGTTIARDELKARLASSEEEHRQTRQQSQRKLIAAAQRIDDLESRVETATLRHDRLQTELSRREEQDRQVRQTLQDRLEDANKRLAASQKEAQAGQLARERLEQQQRLLAKRFEGLREPRFAVERIEPRHLDCRSAEFPSLPSYQQAVEPIRPLNVCIITPDFVGPIRNGGIGTAYRYVADLLAAAGHNVTVLFVLGSRSERGPIEEWVDYYKTRGITFVPMPDPDVASGSGELGRVARHAYGAYEWLRRQSAFDLVHVSEWHGTGYFCLLAKRLGVAFPTTLFCVKCSSPTLWNREGGSTYFETHLEIGTSYMERRSVELGDVVVSGSLHLLRWMLENGYNLDRKRCHVQPNVMLAPDTEAGAKTSGKRYSVDQIVFFGRLEPRKGLHVFCDAVSRLALGPVHPKKIIFAGKLPRRFPAADYISKQAETWPFEHEIRSNMSQPEVVSFLQTGNRMAVIPSLLENSSFAIYECLMHGIPFICSDTGGNPELIHSDDHSSVLFEPHPGRLHEAFIETLRNGALLPRPSFDNEKNNRTWLDWHATLTHPGRIADLSGALTQSAQAKRPLVSVCITHFNRPETVLQAIASIKHQTYQPLEVILVDDGSTHPEVPQLLDRITEEFRPQGWKVIRQENSYPGASRNRAARDARGEYLLFMDDDNVAKPDEIEIFVDIALATRADMLTCFADVFSGAEAPNVRTRPDRRYTPLGASVPFGFFVNGFGDVNALVRRTTFQELGGFTEDYKVGKEDQEFFARAVLRGYKLEVVPLPLYWYRHQPDLGVKSLHYSKSAGTLRVLRPYIDEAPLAYRSILLYARGLQEQKFELARVNRHLRRKANQAKEDIASLGGLLSQIYGSRSWLLTKPLREARSFIKRLRIRWPLFARRRRR